MPSILRSEDLLNAIETRIKGITVANGYETDVGLKVMCGRRKLPADDELPCTQIVEGPDEPGAEAGGQRSAMVRSEQVYVIDSFDTCDPDNPNRKAHQIIRDLKKAIFGGGNRTLDGLVPDIEYLGKDIGPRPDGAATVQARIAFKVSFVEDLSKP